jgi:flagellin
MTVINTNVKSLIAANALKINNRAMSNAMEQLSTGRRINSAADDAAGLAVSEDMTAQIRGLNMAVRNANDGISMAQTAEGALIEVSNMLQRMRELSVQAATGTLSSTQRGYLDDEFQALNEQIQNTVDDTKWNGIEVLGSTIMTSSGGISIQVGTASGQTISVVGASLTAIGTSNFSGGITSTSDASAMLDTLDDALIAVNTARASLGAVVNQLTSAADNLTNVSQNLAESRSRVLDTDYAAATTELARTQIIQQAGMAVLAQANQQPQSVLALLR